MPELERAVRHLCPALSLLALLACGNETGPSNHRALLRLSGHFVGTWDLQAADTTLACGVNSCGYPTIGHANCPIALDLTMTGDTTFSGVFATDTTGGCLSEVAGLSLVAQGTIAQGVVVSQDVDPTGQVSGALEFVLGANTAAEFQRQFGCALLGTESTFVMRGAAGDPGAFAPGSGPPGATQLIYAAGATPSGPFWVYDLSVQCAGRVQLLRIGFVASRR